MESAALYNILGIPIIETIFVGQKKCRNGRLKEGPIRHTNMKQVHFEVMVRSYLPESLYLKLCVENNSTHYLSYRDSYPIPETSSENNLVIKLIPSLNHSRVYPVLLETRKLEVKNRKKNKKISNKVTIILSHDPLFVPASIIFCSKVPFVSPCK